MGPRGLVITIDGPAGAGKTTVARLLADRLGYELIPTGAMYRALALSILRVGVSADDSAALARHLAPIDVRLSHGRVLLDGEDITREIRTQAVADATSTLSMRREIRDKVTPLQRLGAEPGGVVLEGRDTGTVVCPQADVKFFVTASLESRARRRHAELAAQGIGADLDVVRDEIKDRDRQDTTRALAPLVKAPDALEIDTSDLTIEQVVERMRAAIEARQATPPRSRFYAAMRTLAVAIMRAMFGLEATGTEHVPVRGRVLLVSNHSSLLDPPLVGGACPRQLTFLAKAELFDVPGLGRLIHALNARPVRREGADAAALRVALRVLEQGGALLVFPEGTRGPEGQLREPKPGAALLAVLSGAPVVPVFVRGSGRAWPRGRRLPRPAKVKVAFGPSLRFPRPAGGDRKDYYDSVSRDMMAAIAQLQNH
jgi:cytidylate kinase